MLEHASYTFAFRDVSRVFTHELVRHRAGSAFSQESLRYVRLADIGFRVPPALEPLREQVVAIVEQLEELQVGAARELGLDDDGVPFAVKKEVDFGAAPPRAARSVDRHHLDRQRPHPAPRHRAAHRARRRGGAAPGLRRGRGAGAGEAPALFQDFTRGDDGTWIPAHGRV